MGYFDATNYNSWKLASSVIFIIITFSVCSYGSSEFIRINGVNNGFNGDFEKFTCELQNSNVNQENLNWNYRFSNGKESKVTERDMLSSLEVKGTDETSGTVSLTSFIRLTNKSEGVVCSTPMTSLFHSVKIQDGLEEITSDYDACKKTKERGVPVSAIQMTSLDFLPSYRKSYYSDGKTISIGYPTQVSQVKLICFSEGDSEYPTWSTVEGQSSKINFAVWALPSQTVAGCKRQILEIYEVGGESTDEVTVKLYCRAGSRSKSPELTLTFKMDQTKRIKIDNNSTANCINDIVESFYDKELTGVSVGGSLAIILMMIGMAVLKKQLNQQQSINRDLQQQNPNNSREILTAHPQPSSSTSATPTQT